MAMKETLEVQKRNSGLSRVLIPSSHGVNASTNNAHSVMRSSKVALVSGKKLSNYDLQRDYTVLAREKKVTTILEDIKLRSKLESILHEQMEGKITPKASHPLSYPCPSGWQKEARPLHQQLRVRGIVIPINDVCGEAASRYTLAESQALAPGGIGSFLINAFGLMPHEVTAANLVHVNWRGVISDPGTTGMTGMGEAGPGLVLLCALYRVRPDIGCIILLYHTAAVAVSSMSCGLLQISSQAASVGMASYCDLGTLAREDNLDQVAAILGNSKVLVLRGCGMLVVGNSIEEAFSTSYILVKACEIQVAMMSARGSAINADCQRGCGGGHHKDGSSTDFYRGCGGGDHKDGSSTDCQHGYGGRGHKDGMHIEKRHKELEFEALMRMLDNMGYQTGYQYPQLQRHCLAMQPGQGSQPEEMGEWDFLDLKKVKLTEVGPKKTNNEYGENKFPENFEKVLVADQNIAGTHLEGEEDMLYSLQRLAGRLAAKIAQSVPLKGISIHKEENLNVSARVKQTAQRVANSTGHALQKVTLSIKADVSLLQQVEQMAEEVSKSTGDALQRLITLNTSDKKQEADKEAELDKMSELEQLTTLTPPRHSQQRHRNPLGKLTAMHVPLAVGNLTLTSSPDISTSSSSPKHATGHKLINHSQIQLPSLLLNTDEEDPRCPENLCNEYYQHGHQNPLTFPHLLISKKLRKQKRGSCDNTSSSCEYSTIGSIDLVQAHIREIRFSSFMTHKKSTINNPDLEVSPLGRICHTAELVAESTSKAVLTLTASLQC